MRVVTGDSGSALSSSCGAVTPSLPAAGAHGRASPQPPGRRDGAQQHLAAPAQRPQPSRIVATSGAASGPANASVRKKAPHRRFMRCRSYHGLPPPARLRRIGRARCSPRDKRDGTCSSLEQAIVPGRDRVHRIVGRDHGPGDAQTRNSLSKLNPAAAGTQFAFGSAGGFRGRRVRGRDADP